MKTSAIFPRWLFISSTVVLFALMSTATFAQLLTNNLRVGVYDSRAIAIAYGNSAEFQNGLKPLMADYAKAKADKDEKRMKAIDAKMKLQQRRLHEQGFSTGSVAYIMAKPTMTNALPEVAKKAGVQIIVSKWELNQPSPDVELVDVTDELVAPFHPSEKVLNWVKSCKEQKPLPIEEITDDMD
jgi:hypothetical protein